MICRYFFCPDLLILANITLHLAFFDQFNILLVVSMLVYRPYGLRNCKRRGVSSGSTISAQIVIEKARTRRKPS